MSLTKDQLDKLLTLANIASKAAGEFIQNTSGDFEISNKKITTSLAANIVTDIDIKSQNIILDILNPSLKEYDLGLLTEESTDDNSRFEKDYFWCIDPLDGTLQFSQNQPGFSVSIALVSKKGNAILGSVFDPTTNNQYYAIKDQGAFKNQNPFKIKTSNENPKTIEDKKAGAVINAIKTLEEAPAIFAKPPKKEQGSGSVWDYAATSIIQSEAGGFNSDYSGNPLNFNPKGSTFMNHCGIIYVSEARFAAKL